MTSSSPDEALHFRGKTLTPESPRPLHVPEPANIPVLENQMDPLFNDTSAYDTLPSVQGASQDVQRAQGLDTGASGLKDSVSSGPAQDAHQPGSFHSGSPQVAGSMNKNDTTVSASTSTSVPSGQPHGMIETPAAQDPANPSLTTGDADSTAHPQSQPNADVASHTSQGVSGASQLDNAVGAWPAQFSPHGRLDTHTAEDNASNAHGHGHGVNFQNLLDNLPPSSSGAPSAHLASEVAVRAAGESSVPQAAYDESSQSALGLPPRPPPQEEPSIHPNYHLNDDIRSYHQIPPNTSNTPSTYSNVTQDSNPGQSTAPTAAPGTASGNGALPPPPMPSFQHSSEITSEPGAQLFQVNQKAGGLERQPGRPSKIGDEDTPWGPEVQKLYDEFLREERVYVTEGLWDRFPYGSRLFVGVYAATSCHADG